MASGFSSPRQDINITVGYEGTDFSNDHTSGSLDSSGWNHGGGGLPFLTSV